MHQEAFKAQTSLISLHLRQDSVGSTIGLDFNADFQFDLNFLLDDPLNINHNNNNNNIHLLSKQSFGQNSNSSYEFDSMINNSLESMKNNLNYLHSNDNNNSNNHNDSGLFNEIHELDLSDIDFSTFVAANATENKNQLVEQLQEKQDTQNDGSLSLTSEEIDLIFLSEILNDPHSISSNSYDQLNSPSAEVSYNNLDAFDSKKTLTAAVAYEHSINSPSDSTSSYLNTNSEDSNMMIYNGEESCMSESVLSASDLKKYKRIKGNDSISSNKRESNKAAANRYRMKKLKEKDSLFEECLSHEKKNMELKRKIDDVQSEINCIKNLLVEALLSKKN